MKRVPAPGLNELSGPMRQPHESEASREVIDARLRLSGLRDGDIEKIHQMIAQVHQATILTTAESHDFVIGRVLLAIWTPDNSVVPRSIAPSVFDQIAKEAALKV